MPRPPRVRDKQVADLVGWLQPEQLPLLLDAIRNHDWVYVEPADYRLLNGAVVPLRSLARAIRIVDEHDLRDGTDEPIISDEIYGALDEAGFAWTAPTRPAPLPDRRRTAEATPTAHASATSLDEVLELERRAQGGTDEPFVAWLAEGAAACVAAGVGIIDALADPDLTVTIEDATIAIGQWAREVARAEARGYVAPNVQRLPVRLRRALGADTLRFLGYAGRILECADRNGHTVITVEMDRQLATWLADQRARHDRPEYSPAWRAALVALGVDLETPLRDQVRALYLEAMEAWYETHDGPMPIATETIEIAGRSVRIGTWVQTQRNRLRDWELPPKELDDLLEHGFAREFGRPRATKWSRGLAALDQLCPDGIVDVDALPATTEVDGVVFPLREWITEVSYRARRGDLGDGGPGTKLAALRDAGVDPFARRNERTIQRHLAALAAIRSDDPTAPIDRDSALGRWIAGLPKALRYGALSEETVQTLARYGVTANRGMTLTERWNRGFDALVAFRNEHGRLPRTHAPAETIDLPDHPGFGVGTWLRRQLDEYRKPDHGRLSEHQIRLLEGEGVRLNRARNFDTEGRSQFIEYVAEHGNGLVPEDCPITLPNGRTLFQWVLKIREDIRHERIVGDELQALIDDGFVPNVYRYEHERRVEAVAQFRDRAIAAGLDPTTPLWIPETAADEVLPTGEVVPLGNFVKSIRLKHRRESTGGAPVDADLRAALDDLGFAWAPPVARPSAGR